MPTIKFTIGDDPGLKSVGPKLGLLPAKLAGAAAIFYQRLNGIRQTVVEWAGYQPPSPQEALTAAADLRKELGLWKQTEAEARQLIDKLRKVAR
jgi:hypothetical protein